MISQSTVRTARWIAEALSEANHELHVASPNYPLAIMAEHFRATAPGLKREISHRGYEYLAKHFQKINEQATDEAGDDLDRLTDLMETGVRKMLITARTVIVPACKGVVESIENVYGKKKIPPIAIKPFAYTPVFSAPGLTEHLATYPGRFGVKEKYRTFIMGTPDVDTIIGYLAATPLVDSDAVREWALSLPVDDIREVWYSLFDRRELYPADIGFIQHGRFPFNLDRLLVAYFLTAYLRDNPDSPSGENVSLEEWEAAMTQLHALMGLRLIDFHKRRQTHKKQGLLILSTVGFDKGIDSLINEDQGSCVVVNPDVMDLYVEKGGDPRALLGAAACDPQRRHVDALIGSQDYLCKEWDRRHTLIKVEWQNKMNTKSNDLVAMCVIEQMESLGHVSTPAVTGREVIQTLVAMGEQDQNNLSATVVEAICRTYYPTNARQYIDFFHAMDRHGVDVTTREAATLATVEMVASWLRGQMITLPFKPSIAPQPENVPAVGSPAPVSESTPDPSPAAEPSEEVTPNAEPVST